MDVFARRVMWTVPFAKQQAREMLAPHDFKEMDCDTKTATFGQKNDFPMTHFLVKLGWDGRIKSKLPFTSSALNPKTLRCTDERLCLRINHQAQNLLKAWTLFPVEAPTANLWGPHWKSLIGVEQTVRCHIKLKQWAVNSLNQAVLCVVLRAFHLLLFHKRWISPRRFKVSELSNLSVD